MDEDNIILCRCENLTLGKLHRLLDQGITSMQEIKKETRCMMGPCQGRGCRELIAKEISRYLGTSLEQIDIPVSRAPVEPVSLGEIARKGDYHA